MKTIRDCPCNPNGYAYQLGVTHICKLDYVRNIKPLGDKDNIPHEDYKALKYYFVGDVTEEMLTAYRKGYNTSLADAQLAIRITNSKLTERKSPNDEWLKKMANEEDKCTSISARNPHGLTCEGLEYDPAVTPLGTGIESGSHLGVVRRWIQSNAINGETVTWGSQELLKLKPITVDEMEKLAQRIKDAVLMETKMAEYEDWKEHKENATQHEDNEESKYTDLEKGMRWALEFIMKHYSIRLEDQEVVVAERE